jgi:hypothetical protein
MIGIAAVQTAIEYEYRPPRRTEYRFAEHEHDEIRCDERPFWEFSDLNLDTLHQRKHRPARFVRKGSGLPSVRYEQKGGIGR